MKRIFVGVCLCSLLGVAHASKVEIINAPVTTFGVYASQHFSMIGVQNSGLFGTRVTLDLSDIANPGHALANPDKRHSSLNNKMLNGKSDRFEAPADYLGFNNGNLGNSYKDDLAVGVNIVSVVPEPETWAMLLAGIGLIGISARRRRSDTFD